MGGASQALVQRRVIQRVSESAFFRFGTADSIIQRSLDFATLVGGRIRSPRLIGSGRPGGEEWPRPTTAEEQIPRYASGDLL